MSLLTSRTTQRAIVVLATAFLSGCSATAPQADTKPETPVETTTVAVATPPASAQTLPATIVDVDGTTMSRDELTRHIEQFLASGSAGNIPPTRVEAVREQIRPRIIDQFVVQTLLLNEAEKQKIVVTDKAIAERVAELKTQLPPHLSFEEALKSSGITEKELATNIRRDMTCRDVVEQHMKNIETTTEEDAKAFYTASLDQFKAPESVKARHILFMCKGDVAPEEREAKKTIAGEVRKALVDGGDFAALAKQHSDCPSKEKGGDLGHFGRGQMVKPFEEVAFSAKINEISDVVTTDFGYHIIEVTERRDAGVTPFEEVKTDIQRHLDQQLQQKAFETYIEALRGKATITYGKGQEPPTKS